MSELIPNYVRMVVSKLKDLTSRRTEWESIPEQEAEPGWDSHANSEWETDKRDSGYDSFGDTPLKEDPSSSDSINAIKYSNLPFKTKHYLLTHIQYILEATCLRYARENLSSYLTDPEWKKKNLLFSSSEYPPDRHVGRDWLAEDEMELESWMKMFAQRTMPKSQRIFQSVVDLRNVAVHRGDRDELKFKELSSAMEFPKLLGDSKGESEITNAFRYVMQDSTLDEDTKASVEKAMYTPRPCTSHYRVLDRIQTLLEETCFNNAVRNIPAALTEKGCTSFEQIELQNWQDIFRSAQLIHDDAANDIFPDIHPFQLSTLLGGARIHIRNTLAHRSPLSDGKLVTQVHRAINICILQNDWDQAVEIELLAEGYFTKLPRQSVLERLEDVYQNGKIETPYERRRRVAIAGVVARAAGREVGEGDATVLSETCDVSDFEVVWEERTWSPSMHEVLKRVEEL